MTEAEQFRLTRWGIPGWTAILSAVCFAMIDIALTPPNAPNPLYFSIKALFDTSSAMSPGLAALLAAAAGVPLGFCIYQAYFWLRWDSPASRDGLLPPLVVGRQDDLDRTMRKLTSTDIERASQWRKDWVEHPLFGLDHAWRWRYMENLFMEAAQHIDSQLRDVSVFARHQSLLDRMHTLGATLAGIYVGYLGYLLAKAKLQPAPLTQNLIWTGLALLLLVPLLAREDAAKNALESAPPAHPDPSHDRVAMPVPPSRLTRRLHISPRVSHPSAMLLIVAFSILFAASPSPYNRAPANPSPLRLFVPGALVVAWCLAKWKGPRDILITEIAMLAPATLAVCLLGVSGAVAPLSPDWPFCWSLLAFMLANLAFLQNRQNARDDVIALEYYTLRRFLTDGEAQGQPPARDSAPSDCGPTIGCT
jgi:hypothetical protein